MEHTEEGPGRDATVRGRRRAWRGRHCKGPGGDDIDTEEEPVGIRLTQKDHGVNNYKI